MNSQKKGFTKTQLLDADAELYVPIPPKELIQERRSMILPFYIRTEGSGLQRINVIIEYYSEEKNAGILVIETYIQVGIFVYRKLISMEEVVDNFSDKKLFFIGMFYAHFLTNNALYYIYKEYMKELHELVAHIPNIEIEHGFGSAEELLEGFTEV